MSETVDLKKCLIEAVIVTFSPVNVRTERNLSLSAASDSLLQPVPNYKGSK